MSDAVITRVRIVDARSRSGDFRPLRETRAPVVDTPPDDKERDAWQEGYDAAMSEFERDRAAMAALIAAAEALQPEPSEELAAMIAETVFGLVVGIVGDHVPDRAALHARATRAVALIGECDAARTMSVHPQDVQILSELDLGLTVVADPDRERGSIRIDCSPGWIEHGTTLYLEALRAELGLKGYTL